MEEGPVPEEITCAEQVFDISFHPTAHVVATGLIDGTIEVWSYGLGEEANKKMFSNENHQSSCRGVCFSNAGDMLYSISSDRSLQAVDGNGKQTFSFPNAHNKPINKFLNISDHAIVTGDDAGTVKLWDIRVGSEAVMEWQLHEDFVSGLAFHEGGNALLSVSGDATLCAYDMRNQNVHYRSDEQESELHCIQVIKSGRKVIAGTQDGVILVFSWDRWGDCSDRYPGHPETVDCMYKVDESTVVTGSSDGLLRVVAIQPNKILGVIGDHEEFPVEGMCANRDNTLLGSFAHDEVVRFWDISMFKDDDGEEFDEEEEVENGAVPMSGEKAGCSSSSSSSSRALEQADGSGGQEGTVGKKRKNKKIHTSSADNPATATAIGPAGDEPDAEAAEMEEREEDWEDMDDDEEEEEEEEEMEMEESGESSDSDDSEDDSSGGNAKGPKRLPTAAEKFYADL